MVIIRQLYADNDLQSLILSLTDPRPERMTTRNQDRQIKLAHLRNRFKTLTSTARETPGRHKQRISGQTVQRRLKESLRSARRSYRGPVLTCRQGCSEQEVICNGIVYIGEESFFSDESHFHLSRSDGRTRIWRRRGERYASCCVEEVEVV